MKLNLENPTEELANTSFYQKYQEGRIKIQNIKDNINSICGSSPTLEIITELDDSYKKLFSKYLDLAQNIYDTITNATQCISRSLGDDVELPAADLKKEAVKSMSKIMDLDESIPLYDLYNRVIGLERQINQTIQQGCEALTDIVNDAYSELTRTINSALDKVNEMFNAVDQYAQILDYIARTMAKIAAIANCVGDAAGSLAAQSAVFDPGDASILQNVANTSGSVNDKMKAGIETMKQVQDIPNKLIELTNFLKF